MDLNRLVQFAIDLDEGVRFSEACKRSGVHNRQGFHWLNRLEEWGVQLNAVSGMVGQYRVASWGPINIKHYRGKK